MEGDIDRCHRMTSVRKVYQVAFLCHGVAKKFAFESERDKLGQGRRVILEKFSTSKDLRWKGEER